jgi:hypothetical protein
MGKRSGDPSSRRGHSFGHVVLHAKVRRARLVMLVGICSGERSPATDVALSRDHLRFEAFLPSPSQTPTFPIFIRWGFSVYPCVILQNSSPSPPMLLGPSSSLALLSRHIPLPTLVAVAEPSLMRSAQTDLAAGCDIFARIKPGPRL